MTVTQTFALTAGQLITASLRKLGVIEDGGTPSASQFFDGLTALNAMIASFSRSGSNVWRQTQESLTLDAGATFIALPYVVTGIENAFWLTNSGQTNQNSRPLGLFGYDEYQQLPNKLQQTDSGPSVYMLDKQVSTSNLYVWPTATYGGTIIASVIRSSYYVGAVGDAVDIPAEWFEAAIYNLADRLMDDYGVAASDQITAQRITERAVKLYEDLLDFDRPTRIILKPWGRKGEGRFWRPS